MAVRDDVVSGNELGALFREEIGAPLPAGVRCSAAHSPRRSGLTAPVAPAPRP